MKKRERLKIPIKIFTFLTVMLLLTGGSPVSAFNMESRKYKLELESSDIKPIAQDYARKEESVVLAGIPSPKKDTLSIFKVSLVILAVFSLFVWVAARIKKDFELKRREP